MNAADSPAAALAWLVQMGADEAIGPAPIDRLASRPPAAPAVVAPAPARVPMLREAPSPRFEPGVAPPASPGTVEAAQTARALAAAAGDLAALEAAVRAFDGCSLKRTATNTVFADGVPGAPVMFVGEGPGEDEDRQGRPFVGRSGQLLDRMLAAIGLDRARNAYIANIVYWRPPGNRTPTAQETSICLPFIQRQIELAAPRLLILVGRPSANTLLGTSEAIGRLRGRWHPYRSAGLAGPIQALATFHPAYLLRSPGQKRESWRDLLLIKNELSRLGK